MNPPFAAANVETLAGATEDDADIEDTKTASDLSEAGQSEKDYVEHIVLPTDTLQGICLAYRLSERELKRANGNFSSLRLAPAKLLVPISKAAKEKGIKVQGQDSKEYKLHAIRAAVPDLGLPEAKL